MDFFKNILKKYFNLDLFTHVRFPSFNKQNKSFLISFFFNGIWLHFISSLQVHSFNLHIFSRLRLIHLDSWVLKLIRIKNIYMIASNKLCNTELEPNIATSKEAEHSLKFDLIWFDLIWFDLIWFDLICLSLGVVMMDNFCQWHDWCKNNLLFKGRLLTNVWSLLWRVSLTVLIKGWLFNSH